MITCSAFFPFPFLVNSLVLSPLDDLIRVLGDDLKGKVDVALLQEAGANSEPGINATN